MPRLVRSFFLCVMIFATAAGAAPRAERELLALLSEFLAGAGRSDAAVHERFWAPDLIYTGSAGRRMGKSEILQQVRSAPAPKAGDPATTYSAQDVRIRQYGDTAVVAFQLVASTPRGSETEVATFLNSGTFIRRAGKWQAVNWQATKQPPLEEEARKAVAAADAAYHRAMLTGDVASLESLLDETFVRTFRDGSRQSKRDAVEELRSGALKFEKLESSNVTVDVYADAAVVRGKSSRQRTAVPGSQADPAPFELFYTMTLVHRGGSWKIVALHASHS